VWKSVQVVSAEPEPKPTFVHLRSPSALRGRVVGQRGSAKRAAEREAPRAAAELLSRSQPARTEAYPSPAAALRSVLATRVLVRPSEGRRRALSD
jgi:hypothetical protein